jgi:RNA exonuclease 4
MCLPTEKVISNNSSKNPKNKRRQNRQNTTDYQNSSLSALSSASSETADYNLSSSSYSNSSPHRHRTPKKTNSTGNNNRKKPYVSKATSTKPHDAPMQKRDIYFALDCEMVGVGPEGLDSALARVSIINWNNEIVLDSYVKVEEKVTDYRTFISGITPEDIGSASAMTIEEVRQATSTILRGKILIGHGLENDLKAIGIGHPWCDVRDTATYEPFMKKSEHGNQDTLLPRKLRDLSLEILGKQIQVIGKAHSSVEDAIASMDLYKAVRPQWEVCIMKQVNSCNHASSNNVDLASKGEMYKPGSTHQYPLTPSSPQTVQHFPHPTFMTPQGIPHQAKMVPPIYVSSRGIGGAYLDSSKQYHDNDSRLAAARLAQEEARMRAAVVAVQYQHEMNIIRENPHYFAAPLL